MTENSKIFMHYLWKFIKFIHVLLAIFFAQKLQLTHHNLHPAKQTFQMLKVLHY